MVVEGNGGEGGDVNVVFVVAVDGRCQVGIESVDAFHDDDVVIVQRHLVFRTEDTCS